jgi:hypothetical protein
VENSDRLRGRVRVLQVVKFSNEWFPITHVTLSIGLQSEPTTFSVAPCARRLLSSQLPVQSSASAPIVRRHFNMEWRKRALREEQGTREETEARRKKAHSAHYPHRAAEVDEETSWNATPDIRRPWSGHGYGHRIAGVRYRFCVAVDEAALQSVISSEGETRTGIAWMKLIEGD